MLGESEYHRIFKPPSELQAHSPPQSSKLAGVSSAKLAVTQEPAFPRRKKAPGHERKVTFTTDYTENGGSLSEDDVAMRYRAGFRRAEPKIPTEYQLQYTWKAPVDGSPLLTAEHALHRHGDHSTKDEVQSPSPIEVQQLQVKSTQGGDQVTDQREVRFPGGGRGVKGRGVEVGGEGGREGSHGTGNLEGLGAPGYEEADNGAPAHPYPSRAVGHPPTSSPLSRRHKCHKCGSGKRHHHHHKKHHHHHTEFMSEYRAQFKPWAVSVKGKDATDEDDKPLPGAPRVLTDPTDPRLLKHSSMPAAGTPKLTPGSQWGSEYSSNFVPPTEFKFVSGAWQGAPHPDLFYQPTLLSAEKEKRRQEKVVQGEDAQEGRKPEGHSWFEQVVELHQKADGYKRRAQGTYFSREYLLLLQDKQRELFERASSTCSCSRSSITSGSSLVSGSLSPVNEEGSRRGGGGELQVEDIEGEGGELGPRAEPRRPRPTVRGTGMLVGHEYQGDEDEETDTPIAPSEPPLNTEPSSEQPEQDSQDKPTTFPLYEGRVPTPDLQDGVTHLIPRHHLDLTTPADGGILTSPIKLPYPPASPKYRKDMRSVAPIFPSPKPKMSEMRSDAQGRGESSKPIHPLVTQGQKAVSGATMPRPMEHVRYRTTVSKDIRPAHPPLASSPHVANTSRSDAVRQLQFDTRARAQGSQTARTQASHMESCVTCGSSLRPPTSRPCPASLGRQPVRLRDEPKDDIQPSRRERRRVQTEAAPARGRVTYTGPQGTSTAATPYRRGVSRPGYVAASSARLAHTAPSLPSTRTDYGIPPPVRHDRDIDELSLSSCSVASDLLRRAQDRRDYFWTRPLET